ncbi:LysR family transcriptional regulator [Nocardioides sp.]|uniref:LysR family transcriptional regulator n=1 Tax=Nocardioides sp. TaxID=35761 RepID=UPI0039E69CD2
MRLEQLEYVAAVTRTGSLRQASEQLHVSKPAMSEAISKLEKELGVSLLDRRRSGARMSRQGRDLLPLISEVLDAAGRLRAAAGQHATSSSVVRIGTVNTATPTLVTPALREFQRTHPATGVELVALTHVEIVQALEEGSLDFGLANLLEGDDLPAALRGTFLMRCHPVVVLPAGHQLATASSVTTEELRQQRFVMMRSGFLMHRYAHRLFGARLPRTCHTADGGEIGKLMVAQGLGVMLLPEFSVADDPLEQAGLIVRRPLAEPTPAVRLVLMERRASTLTAQVRALRDAFVEQATRAS